MALLDVLDRAGGDLLAGLRDVAPPHAGVLRPGPFDRIGDWITDNRYALMALGAGIAGAPSWAEGIGRGLQMAVAGAQADRQRQMLSAQQAATAQALRERRVPNAELIAAMHPQLARILLTRPDPPGAARDDGREAARLTR